MSHFNNFSRKTLNLCVLLMFMLLVQMADAKHIIIIYDVSGSMVSLKIDGKTNRYMEADDIKRVNEYLTDLLFTNAAQSLRDTDDSIIKECDAAYVGKPLYQSGDIITFAKYAKRRNTTIDRKQVDRVEFKRQLPTEFPGQVSYLLRAEVEVYDVLYNDTDDETLWVFVTDGDIDNSGKSDPGISEVLKRHAEIEDEFYSPMIFSMLINKHVRIQVRKLQKSSKINTIFLSTPTKPGKPVNEIQLDRNNEGKFISETLTFETHNSDKSKFKLNSVNVEIVNKFNKPIQTMTDEGVSGVIKVPPVSLNNKPPPCEFRIPFPSHSEISAPENALKLTVTYNFNGKNETYTPNPIPYTAVIDSIFVSVQDKPNQQVKELNLNFSDDTFRTDLVVQSESYNKKAFKIEEIRSHIQYRDGRKLSNVTIPKVTGLLEEPFSIEVPKHSHLDWYGNKVVLDIDYEYDNQAKTETIEIPYNLIGGSRGFPMWLLWVFLLPVAAILVYMLISHVFIRPPIEHNITLSKVSGAGTQVGDVAHYTLKDDTLIEFGPRGPNELRFDVGSKAYLHCQKKNILLFQDEEDEEGQILDIPDTLILGSDEAKDIIQVALELADDSTDEIEKEDEPYIEYVNPIDV